MMQKSNDLIDLLNACRLLLIECQRDDNSEANADRATLQRRLKAIRQRANELRELMK